MSRVLRQVKARDLVRVATRLGFLFDHQEGSHAVYYRASDRRRAVIIMHGSRPLRIGTVRKTLQDLNITPEDFERLK